MKEAQVSASSNVRALQRRLHVLKMLQTSPASTLQDVHRATGIAKPSLLRILATLEREGMIRRRLDDGRYCISAKLARGGQGLDAVDCIAEAQRRYWLPVPKDFLAVAFDNTCRRSRGNSRDEPAP
jgi:DNA-binding MarR family transcriptional regulator